MAANTKKHKEFYEGIVRGNIAVLGQAITMAESSNEKHRAFAGELLKKLLNKTGRSFRLGITGVPGVGKSSFIESFGIELVKKGHKVAVLAVDPTSSKSKGSILGDKTRMEQLSKMREVFIRPSPSGGTLGGVARSTYESILLCEAAGYDFIIIETVGVGQSEIAVNGICDFFLLLMLAGAGDELQGIKRGIMEMADAVVITKADGSNLEKAKAARSEFARALHFLQMPESGFTPRVEICSSLENKGMDVIWQMLESYTLHVHGNGYFEKKRKEQRFELFMNSLTEELNHKFLSSKKIGLVVKKIKNKKNILPFEEANRLVSGYLKR